MAIWRVHIGSFFHLVHGDGSAYFFFTTVTPLFLLVGYLLVMMFGLHETDLLRPLNWNWMVSLGFKFRRKLLKKYINFIYNIIITNFR